MTTNTTVVQAIPSGPEPKPPILGSMTQIPNAMAHLEYAPEKPKKPGKAVLYSCGKSYVPVKTGSCKKFKESKLSSKCQKLWELTTKFVHEKDAFATEIEIKAVPHAKAPHRDLITISYKDKLGETKVLHASEIDQEIVGRMEKIRKIVRPSRDFSYPEPLQLSLPKDTLFPKTCSEFLKKEHKRLEESLPEPQKKEAFRHIVATEAMIQGFQKHLKAIIDGKEEELKPEKTPELPHPPRKRKEEELRKLKELQRELEMIDRNAVFRAIANWGNLNSNALGDKRGEELKKGADLISLTVKRDLEQKDKERRDKHWITNKFTSETPVVGSFAFKPLESSEIHGYALDAGNLLFEEQLDARDRSLEGDDKVKKSSVEQLIVQMMMNLKDEKVHISSAHPLFEGLAEEDKEMLVATIEAPLPPSEEGKPTQYYPKAYARKVHEYLETIGVSDLETALHALSANPDKTYAFSSLLK